MQAQRRRLLPSYSPFAGLSASGPPEMDFPQFVEDTRDATFHKDISTGSLLGLAAPFTRLSSICPGECEVGERFSPRRSCPDRGLPLPNLVREGLPTILSVSTICGQRSCLKLTTAPTIARQGREMVKAILPNRRPWPRLFEFAPSFQSTPKIS